MSISSPEDKKKLKGAIQEISNSMTRMEAERDLIKEIIKEQSDQFQIPKKILAKIAKTYHKQNLTQEVEEHEDFVEMYDEITK
jgi:hypothetical protein